MTPKKTDKKAGKATSKKKPDETGVTRVSSRAIESSMATSFFEKSKKHNIKRDVQENYNTNKKRAVTHTANQPIKGEKTLNNQKTSPLRPGNHGHPGGKPPGP